MSGENWTPGPWYLIEGPQGAIPAARITSGASASVFAITKQTDDYSEALAVAPNCARIDDAHLIAAAPELYEALQTLVDEKIEYMRINYLGDPHRQSTVIRAEKALAKARGEQT